MPLTRRPALLLLALSTLLVGVVAVAPRAEAADTVVRVHSQSFDPASIQIDPGDTVTWLVQQDDHTIVAEDGTFAFRGPAGTSLSTGDTASHRFGAEEKVVRYFCEIHRYMQGSITVGNPQPPPPPPPPTVRVPTDVATLADALAVIGDGGVVELEPGVHEVSAPPTLGGSGISIVGLGATPADVQVVPTPGSQVASAVRITGRHPAVRNLTISGFADSGLLLDDADAALIADVVVSGGGVTRDGIAAVGVAGTTVTRSTITGARRSGVRVSGCPSCGARISGSTLSGNLVGLLVEGGKGVIVHDNTVRDNGAGIVARNGTERGALRPSTVVVHDNLIRDNQRTDLRAGADVVDRSLANGTGIWLAGVTDSLVEANDVAGSSYGIALAAGEVVGTKVLGNVIDRSRHADVGWDGIGAQTCFAGNQRPFLPARTHPDRIETLYPCDRPTVGVPFPLVLVNLSS